VPAVGGAAKTTVFRHIITAILKTKLLTDFICHLKIGRIP